MLCKGISVKKEASVEYSKLFFLFSEKSITGVERVEILQHMFAHPLLFVVASFWTGEQKYSKIVSSRQNKMFKQ